MKYSKSSFTILITVMIMNSKCSENNVAYEIDEAAEERLKQGTYQYNEMRQFSSLPQYGECWSSAVKTLQSGCRHLTPEVQSRLAIRFTSCFRQGHSLSAIDCDDSEEISACTSRMDERAYQTFSSYFTHTQNMCYYLQSQIWNQETRKTVAHLSRTSQDVMKKLEDARETQQKLQDSQQATLDKQESILKSGDQLTAFLSSSSNQIQQVFSEIKSSTREHEQVIGAIFMKVEKLQSLVLGEFTGFYTILYYSFALVSCYLLTSAPRTSSARFWLFSIVSANAVLERIVVNEAITESHDMLNPLTENLNDVVYYRVNICRKLSAILAIIVLIVCAWRFKDLAKVNNELLLQIQKQNQEMAVYIRGQLQGKLANGSVPSLGQDSPSTLAPFSLPGFDIVDSFSNLPDYESDLGSDDDSEESYDSLASDHSYHPPIPSNSRDSTPTPSLRSQYVANRISALPSFLSPIRRQSRSKTPVVVRSYNLRNRTISPTAAVTNPIVGSETEHSFARQVNRTCRQTQRNASILRQLARQGETE